MTDDPAVGAEPEPADDADTQGHSMADSFLARELARGREREIQQSLKVREHALAARAAHDKAKRPDEKAASRGGLSWLGLRRAQAGK